jgi:hypothetical protein
VEVEAVEVMVLVKLRAFLVMLEALLTLEGVVAVVVVVVVVVVVLLMFFVKMGWG